MSFHSMMQLVAGVFCVCGPALIAGGILALRKARARAAWPTVNGTVVSSQAVEHRTSGVDGKGRHTTRVSWEPVVKYSYEVGGKKHSGKRIKIKPEGMGRRGAEAAAARFLPASGVQVHYNPADPEDAVLDPGAPGVGGSFGIGILLLLVGLLMFWQGPVVIAWFSQGGM